MKKKKQKSLWMVMKAMRWGTVRTPYGSLSQPLKGEAQWFIPVYETKKDAYKSTDFPEQYVKELVVLGDA